VLHEEIYEGLADLIASQFFGHSDSRGFGLRIIPIRKNKSTGIKNPEPVPDPGHLSVKAQRPVSHRGTGSAVEQSQDLGCARSERSECGGLKLDFLFHGAGLYHRHREVRREDEVANGPGVDDGTFCSVTENSSL
jgi:hypothetical protein